MKKTGDNDGCAAVLLLGSLPVLYVTLIWRAFVMHKLWGWFVAPLVGMSSPGVAALYGLFLVLGIIRMKGRDKKETREPMEIFTDTITDVFSMLVIESLSLLAGYIAYSFM